jgi:HSP20 family molecular chaperone IbpA
MANQTGVAKAKEKEAVSSVFIEQDQQQLFDRLHSSVERRAYELYLEGGSSQGNDLANWLQAESEMLAKAPEIRELSSWFTLNIPVAGFAPADVKVAVDADRGLVAGDNRQSEGRMDADDGRSSRDSFFLIAKWPKPVDPETATAYVKNETLTLTVKRSAPAANNSAS